MSIHIRIAEKQDCVRLLELINELAIFEKAPEEVSVTLPEFIEAGFGKKPVWKAFVAQVDGLIVGFALYYIRYSTWKGCRLYLEDFYVNNEYRTLGIGKLLFNTIVQEAKQLNLNGISWQVLDWNTPAINFYKKYGAQLDASWVNGSLSKTQLIDL